MNFDRARCAIRNRVAARRDNIDAAPMQFLRQDQAAALINVSAEDSISRIQALQPEGARPLTIDDVYIMWMEAANDSFIADRFMFLTQGTLKNIAADASAGVAFMNSHRHGSMSTPTELPFGRTFAGHYANGRTVMGVYMLRNGADGPCRPNGDSGPTTGDLYAMIEAGTLFDVSVGLKGGEPLCDLCGTNLDVQECAHLPGTVYGLTLEQRKAQEARGVPQGVASYSLDDSRLAEISPVFDGAIAGAGFRKVMGFARREPLGADLVAQVKASYGSLVRENEFERTLHAGVSFAEQVEEARAAVQSCVDRAESLADLRETDGRRLSATTSESLRSLADRLAALQGRATGSPLRVRQLRLQSEHFRLLEQHQHDPRTASSVLSGASG